VNSRAVTRYETAPVRQSWLPQSTAER